MVFPLIFRQMIVDDREAFLIFGGKCRRMEYGTARCAENKKGRERKLCLCLSFSADVGRREK